MEWANARVQPPNPRALRMDSARTASPKNVMASTTPATMVMPTKARPMPARPPETMKKPSSDQGRFVKGSRTMRRAVAFKRAACSSVMASDSSFPRGRTGTPVSSAGSDIRRPVWPTAAAPSASATAV